MPRKYTKISNTELEVEEEANKYVLTKEQVQKRLEHYKGVVTEYKDLLKKFD